MEPVLVLIKPDAVAKNLTGPILTRLAESGANIVAAKAVRVSRELAEEHYCHLKGQSFFDSTIDFLMGRFHDGAHVLAIVYYGPEAVQRCRAVAGATSPEKADWRTIRGQFGRVTSEGIFENAVHVSSDPEEALREIALWFDQDEIIVDISHTAKENR